MANKEPASNESSNVIMPSVTVQLESPPIPPDVEVKYDPIEEGRLTAIRESAVRLLQAITADEHCDCVWSLKESIWPARSLAEYKNVPPERVTLVLLPLSRIGQMEGKSGSLVLIGYFSDASTAGLPRSHPVVVKTIPTSNETKKLRDEFDNGLSIKPFAYDQKDVFAIPFRFDADSSGFHVLWSIFSASEPVWSGNSAEPSIVVRDLRDPLKTNETETVKAVLSSTCTTLRNCHTSFGRQKREDRAIGSEYEWYLRGFGTLWGEDWHEVWKEPTDSMVEIDGEQRANPLWVVEQLRTARSAMTIGAIHGDLHPGNIVLAPTGHARIIDFGWSQQNAHIAKDFVLLECNIRFLTLRPQLSLADTRRFARWIEWDASTPDDLGDYCRQRADLVLHLRQLARQAFPECHRAVQIPPLVGGMGQPGLMIVGISTIGKR